VDCFEDNSFHYVDTGHTQPEYYTVEIVDLSHFFKVSLNGRVPNKITRMTPVTTNTTGSASSQPDCASIPTLDLPATSPEVKRYHRLKLTASLLSLALSLGFLAVTALLFGPRIDRLVGEWFGNNRWVKLTSLGFFY